MAVTKTYFQKDYDAATSYFLYFDQAAAKQSELDKLDEATNAVEFTGYIPIGSLQNVQNSTTIDRQKIIDELTAIQAKLNEATQPLLDFFAGETGATGIINSNATKAIILGGHGDLTIVDYP